jgi:hypothetical protein
MALSSSFNRSGRRDKARNFASSLESQNSLYGYTHTHARSRPEIIYKIMPAWLGAKAENSSGGGGGRVFFSSLDLCVRVSRAHAALSRPARVLFGIRDRTPKWFYSFSSLRRERDVFWVERSARPLISAHLTAWDKQKRGKWNAQSLTERIKGPNGEISCATMNCALEKKEGARTIYLYV